MSPASTAQQLTAPIADHGEGPVWLAATGELGVLDMLAGDVLTVRADGSVTRRHVGSVAACIRPRVTRGYIVALERGFALDDGDGSPLRELGQIWANPGVRMNEGGCDPDGRFYCGSMHYDQTPRAGALYRLDTDGTVTTVLTGCGISNGLEWSPDGTRAYYVDSATHRIDIFDYDPSGGLSGRRPFVTVEEADGTPDGLTVDAEGGVWVALWGGSQVRRYSPQGRLDAIIAVPVRQATACTFGGSRLDQLFITTSRTGLTRDDEPQSGAVFTIAAQVAGLPARPYGG